MEHLGSVPVSNGADTARFMTETGVAAEFARVCEPVLDELGFRLVRVALSGSDSATVQIMAERPDGTMSVNECAQVSRALSPLLDAHDPMPGGYQLEVSSPGIDRPLVRPSDFENWAGYHAKIELKELLDGRKRFKGVIEGFEDAEVRLEVELDKLGRTTLGLPVGLIGEAKLVMTDDLIREALRRSKKSGKDVAADGTEMSDGTEMGDGVEMGDAGDSSIPVAGDQAAKSGVEIEIEDGSER